MAWRGVKLTAPEALPIFFGVTSVFEQRELSRLPQILRTAEDLTGSFFKLSSFDPARYPFEVATLRELTPEEIADGAFAQLCRYAVAQRTGLRPRPLYRICLQDHNLLRALARGDASLDNLLLYVLAHELCHVVRFCDFQHLFEADEAARGAEESRVHALTAEIVAPLKNPEIDALARRYAV